MFLKTAVFNLQKVQFLKTAVLNPQKSVFIKKCSFWADLRSETAKTTFPSQPSTQQQETLTSMDFSVK